MDRLRNGFVQPTMVFIQQIETGKFYSKNGTWVADRAVAQEFLTVAVAQQLCRTLRLQGAQVIEKNADGKETLHECR